MAGLRTLSTSQIDPDTTFSNGDALGQMSIGAKYSVNSDVTLEGTYNPDFSVLEADAAQVDVNSTISPEVNFFQEGSDLFITPFNSLAPDGERSEHGGEGHRTLEAASAWPTRRPTTSTLPTADAVNVVLFGNVGNGSTLGFLASQRSYGHGGTGTIFLRRQRNPSQAESYSVVGQGISSGTREPKNIGLVPLKTNFNDGEYTTDGESYWGSAFITEFRRRLRHWNFTLDYNRLSIPRLATRPWKHQCNTFERPITFAHIFERISLRWGSTDAGVSAPATIDFLPHSLPLSAQTPIGADPGVHRIHRRLGSAGLEPSTATSGRPGRTLYSPARQAGREIGLTWGRGPGGERRRGRQGTQRRRRPRLKPIDRLVIEPSYNYSRSIRTPITSSSRK